MTEPDRNKPAHGLTGSEQTQLNGLRRAMGSAGIENAELWLRYYGIGGIVGEYEVEAYLQLLLSLPPLERDLLARAANELIDELPARLRAPYAGDEAPEPENDEPVKDI